MILVLAEVEKNTNIVAEDKQKNPIDKINGVLYTTSVLHVIVHIVKEGMY